MALSPKLRRGLLVVGLAVTAGTVYWASRLPSGEQEAASLVAPAPRASRRAEAAPEKAAAVASADRSGLDLSRLKRDPTTTSDSNLFDTRNFAPAPPKPRPGSQEFIAAARPAAPPPPPPPPPPFTYMGQLADGVQTTVFLVSGERNLVVKAGDVIDNTYRIDEIGPTALVLTYLPQNVKQTLPIGAPQ